MEEQAADELEHFIDNKLEELMTTFDDKMEKSDEVATYLSENFTRYLYELFEHALHGASDHEIDGLVATAIASANKDPFLAEVLDLNMQFTEAITMKKAEIIKHINSVKGGKSLEHEHDERGRIAEDEFGNAIVTQVAVPGFDA